MDRKKIGVVLIIIGLVSVLLNFVVIYPYIYCVFAPLVFWVIAALGIIGGILLYFNVKLFYSEDQ